MINVFIVKNSKNPSNLGYNLQFPFYGYIESPPEIGKPLLILSSIEWFRTSVITHVEKDANNPGWVIKTLNSIYTVTINEDGEHNVA